MMFHSLKLQLSHKCADKSPFVNIKETKIISLLSGFLNTVVAEIIAYAFIPTFYKNM